jgi:hypothetical protein
MVTAVRHDAATKYIQRRVASKGKIASVAANHGLTCCEPLFGRRLYSPPPVGVKVSFANELDLPRAAASLASTAVEEARR